MDEHIGLGTTLYSPTCIVLSQLVEWKDLHLELTGLVFGKRVFNHNAKNLS